MFGGNSTRRSSARFASARSAAQQNLILPAVEAEDVPQDPNVRYFGKDG